MGASSTSSADLLRTRAKFQVPVRRVVVSRAPLVRRITGSDRPLATVTSPAGYGKTTLLVELVASEPRQVVWVSLDPTDADPAKLAKDLAEGLTASGLAPALSDELRRVVIGPHDSAVHRIGAALMGAPRPFVLILDDGHLIDGTDGSPLIQGLIDHVPKGSQLLIAGRTELPFVARRRVTAEVVEISSKDLAFNPDAVLAVYRAEGLPLSEAQATHIVARTEGWAAGVYLSALVDRSRREGENAGSLDIDGSNRYVADYLLHEVLEATEPHVQEFLLDAALLDELHPALCDHALQLDTSAEMLRQLARSNLFVVAIGEDRASFRLHSLFRDFLIAERSHRRSPGDAREVLARAATWCEAHGRVEQGIEYLLRTHDVGRLGPALTAVLQPMFDDGQSTTVDRWLLQAGDDVVNSHPPLAVLAGWMAAVSGRPAQAEKMAAQLEGLSFEGATEDGWASFEASRAAFRALLCADGVDAMSHDADSALEGAPPWSPWRSTAIWLQGEARELQGKREEAAELYDEAVRADHDMGLPPQLVPIVSRALLAIDDRDWDRAEELVEAALRRAEVITPSNYLEGAMAHAAAARCLLHRGERERSKNHLAIAMATRELGTYALPHTSIRLRTTLAIAYAALDDVATATGLLNEVDLIVARRPNLGALLDEVARTRSLLVPQVPGAAALTAAELRVLAHLSSHLTFAEIGKELFVSRHTVHTQAGSIYRKFGVTSRREAVERARALGLI